MKKIALLILAATFVIGTQSCSKEDEVINPQEQQGDVIPENAISADALLNITSKLRGTSSPPSSGCYTKVYVRFYEGSDYFDKLSFLEYARKNRFSSIFANLQGDCEYVNEWYVPCNEVSPIKNDEARVINGTKGKVKDEGETVIPIDKMKMKSSTYDCSDIPPLVGDLPLAL